MRGARRKTVGTIRIAGWRVWAQAAIMFVGLWARVVRPWSSQLPTGATIFLFTLQLSKCAASFSRRPKALAEYNHGLLIVSRNVLGLGDYFSQTQTDSGDIIVSVPIATGILLERGASNVDYICGEELARVQELGNAFHEGVKGKDGFGKVGKASVSVWDNKNSSCCGDLWR